MTQPQQNIRSKYDLNATTRFSSQDISHFSSAQLIHLATHSPPQIVCRDHDVMTWMSTRGITALTISERALVKTAAQAAPQQKNRSVKPDVFTKDTAIPVIYTEKEMVVEEAVPVKIPNTLVPIEVPARAGLSSLVAFMSMWVEVSSGSWKVRGEVASFQKVYTGINFNCLQPLVMELVDNLNVDKFFSALPPMKRNDISKELALKFLSEYFCRISPLDYLGLHCAICYDVFKIYTRLATGQGYGAINPQHGVRYKKDDKGQFIQPLEKEFDGTPKYFDLDRAARLRLSLTPAERKVLRAQLNGKGAPIIFSGRAELPISLPVVDSMNSVQKVIQLTQSISSDNTGPFLLYGMKGFSGIITENGRRVMTLVSLACGQLVDGFPVDIHVNTSGDVSTVVNSMLHATKYLNIPFQSKTLFTVVLTPSDYRKVSDCKTYCASHGRGQEECTFPKYDEAGKSLGSEIKKQVPVTQIYYVDTGLPSSNEKHVAVDWESRAVDYLSTSDDRWIYCGPIFGSYMFGTVATAPTSTALKELGKKPPFSKAFAYQFGDGSCCRGVLSNQKISFIGLLPQEVNDKYTFTPELIPVVCVSTPGEWYEYVRKENGRKLSSWHSPTTRFSSICNLFRQSRKGALASFTDAMFESGQLSPEQISLLNSVEAQIMIGGPMLSDDVDVADDLTAAPDEVVLDDSVPDDDDPVQPEVFD